MPSLGTLTTYLALDDTDFSRRAESAKGKLKQIGAESRATVNRLGKLGVGLAGVGVAIAANLINKSADAARELRTLSNLANTGTTEFQRYAAGARTVGIQNDKLADILKDVNDRIGDFVSTGGGPMADFFENIAPKVGVTADQFRRLSGPQAMQLYVDSLERANVSQEEMTFYMEAMASDATALVPLLRDGGTEMERLGDNAEKAGQILSDIEIERLTQMEQAIADSTRSLEVLTQKVAAGLSPMLIALSNHFMGAAEGAEIFEEEGDAAFDSIVNGAGFVLDAIEGIKRSFQVAGRLLAMFGLGGKEVMLTLARDIVEFPTQATNELINLLNKIPGIDIDQFGMSELGKSIQQEIDLTQGAIDEGWKDINDILLKPLPSGQFKVLVDEAEQAAEDAVKKAERIREAMGLQQQDGETGPNAKEREEQEKERENLQRKLDQIRQANLTELELLKEKQAMERDILAQGKEAELELKGGYQQVEREMAARHEDELTKLTERAAEERRRLEEQKLKARQATTGQILSNLTTLMNTESRKMFEIGKAAGIANSIISTYTGASKALELGWPLGPIAAAAITAKGFAQVAAIRSQSFGGGGGSGGAGSGGSVTGNINDQGEAVQASGQPSERTVANISIQGGDVFSRDSVISLAEQMAELSDDGVRFRVTA